MITLQQELELQKKFGRNIIDGNIYKDDKGIISNYTQDKLLITDIIKAFIDKGEYITLDNNCVFRILTSDYNTVLGEFILDLSKPLFSEQSNEFKDVIYNLLTIG